MPRANLPRTNQAFALAGANHSDNMVDVRFLQVFLQRSLEKLLGAAVIDEHDAFQELLGRAIDNRPYRTQ